MNQLINFIWTIFCSIALVWYWFDAGAAMWLYMLLVFSCICAALPYKLFKYLQLSGNPKFYERLGVKQIKKLVQDGDYINRLLRKRKPGYRVIGNRGNVTAYLKTVIMYERYHFLGFVFFLLTAVHALIFRKYGFTIMITLGNVIYNVFPILLQQYNRSRVLKLAKVQP